MTNNFEIKITYFITADSSHSRKKLKVRLEDFTRYYNLLIIEKR